MIQKNSYTVEEARKKMEIYCSYQERCYKEVEQKLSELNMIRLAKDKIIMYLMDQDYINEERFSKSFARGKFKIKKWGKQRIIRELKFRNISEINIKMALSEFTDEEYVNSFNLLAQKRLTHIKETNIYKKRKKLADYLLYRGWESNLVYSKVTELIP